jgi:hypothetical protein
MLDFPTAPADLTKVNAADAPTFIYRSATTRWRRQPAPITLLRQGPTTGHPLNFALPTGYRRFDLRLKGLHLASGAEVLRARVSFDGGATFDTSYVFAGEYAYTGAALGVMCSPVGEVAIQLSSTMTTTAGYPGQLNLDIDPGSASHAACLRATMSHLYSAGTIFLATHGWSYSAVNRITHLQIRNNTGVAITDRSIELLGVP